MYLNINSQIEGKGSATTPPALIKGTAQLRPISRPMNSKEMNAFEKKFGDKPTPIPVAINALATLVYKDNPVNGLPLVDVDSMFSSTYKLGNTKAKTWIDVGGHANAWTSQSFSIYSRNSASSTYSMFKRISLKKSNFKDTVNEQLDASVAMHGVASDLDGIGYQSPALKHWHLAKGVHYLAPP